MSDEGKKEVTPEDALRAVMAACVATEIRAGRTPEEATRICHARISRQVRNAIERAEESRQKQLNAEQAERIFADIRRQREKELNRGRVSRFMDRIGEHQVGIAFHLMLIFSIWLGIQIHC